MTALPMLLTAQLLAAAVLALTLVWVLHFRGGVSWKPTSKSLLVYTVIIILIHPCIARYTYIFFSFLNSWSNNNMRTIFVRHTLCSW